MFLLPLRKVFLSCLLLFIIFSSPHVVNLARAYPANDCDPNDPTAEACKDKNPCGGCAGSTYWCNSNGYCQYTCTGCSGGCAGTGPLPGGCEFGSWSPCSGCYQTRRCEVGPACSPEIYQIQYCCVVDVGTPTPTVPTPNCSISLSASYSVAAGSSITVSPSYSAIPGTMTYITYTIGNAANAVTCAVGAGNCPVGSTNIFTIWTPNPLNARVTGVAAGSTTLTANGVTSLGATCSAGPVPLTIGAPAGWWQVIGGDVSGGKTYGGGSITSPIPISTCVTPGCEPLLVRNSVASNNTTSGVPSAGASVNLGAAAASGAGWKVGNSPFLSSEPYNYTYFEKKIPSGCTPTVLAAGSVTNASVFASGGATGGACGNYYWYQYNSTTPTTITGNVDLLNRKVILFAKGSVISLGGKINFNDGVGAFYLFSKEDIRIPATLGQAAPSTNPATPDIEGMLFSERQFVTQHFAAAADLQLYIRGMVVGLGANAAGITGAVDGLYLQRNLGAGNSTFPAELFHFAPDLVMNWPTSLTRRTLQWREVAP